MKKTILIILALIITSLSYGQYKRIYQLNTASTYDSDYYVPVDKSIISNTKKMSLGTIAAAINALQDVPIDSLKSAIGLESGYVTDENSNYIKQADFTTIGLTPNLYNADRILDSIARVNADAISGQAGELTSTTISASAAQLLSGFTIPIELLDTPATGYMWDIVSCMISYDYNTTAYTTTGNSFIQIKYENASDNLIRSDIAILQQTADKQVKNQIPTTDYTAYDSYDNEKIILTYDTANLTLGDGTIKVHLVYRKITL